MGTITGLITTGVGLGLMLAGGHAGAWPIVTLGSFIVLPGLAFLFQELGRGY